MDRLTSIQVFVYTVRLGSMAAAARELTISPPMVSKYLSNLEENLGIQLIVRTTRKQHLTDAGSIYFDRCEQILDDINDAHSLIDELKQEPQGNLSINVPVSFGTHHLTKLIPKFQEKHPRVKMNITCSDSIANLVEGGFDLAIRITEELKNSSIRARLLAPCRIIASASPQYLKKHGSPTTLKDLEDRNCLIYSNPEKAKLWKATAPNGEKTAAINGNNAVNNGDFITQLALQGEGIILQPTFIIWRHLRSGELQHILPDHEFSPLNIYAVYPNKKHVPLKVRAFINFMVENLGSNPYWDQW